MLAEGTVLGGKYRIEHKIAKGGMGLVVAATHLKLGIKVALKFLREDFVKDPRIVDRFVREAQAAAQLRSEHVCRVTDVETTDAGVPYIVMELLQGRDLNTVLKTAPLDVETAANYILQACLAIAEAHSIGIVHRDLKPANLYMTYGSNGAPLIKVLDFGVAKLAPAGDDHGMTQTQSVMGSPGYMSPEQLRSSKSVDVRTDVWSLGVTLFELVMGKRPWTADAITELTLKVANDPVPPMPGIPKELVAVVGRCLAKAPEERYQSVAELARALAPLAPDGEDFVRGVERALGVVPTIVDTVARGRRSAPVIAQTSADIDAPPSTPPTTLTTASGVVDHRADLRPRPFKLLAVAAGVATVVIVAVVLLKSGSGSGSSSSAPTRQIAPAHEPASADMRPPPPSIAVDAAVVETPELGSASPATEVATQPVTTPASSSTPASSKASPTKKPAKQPVKKKSKIEQVRDSRI